MKMNLEKRVWSDSDFKVMGWHDNTIYQISLSNGEFALDIDYILQWNKVDGQAISFTYWIAPSTLVFRKVSNFTIGLNSSEILQDEISDIHQSMDGSITHWRIETIQGGYEFDAEGYIQYIRQEPFLEVQQCITGNARGKSSLERTTNQSNPMRNAPEVIAWRKRSDDAMEVLNKRHQEQLSLKALVQCRSLGDVDTKTFIKQKRKLEALIRDFDVQLKGTPFEHFIDLDTASA